MPKLLAKTNLATKTTLLIVCAMLLLALTSFLVASRIVTNNAMHTAEAEQESNMRVAWSVLRGYGGDFRLEGDTIYVGNRALNDWHEPVDRIKDLVGGTATSFAGDTRVATNVMKDDGSRAVGTKLARNAAYDAVLVSGKPYRGQADILGKPFFTAYDPIKNASGETIGVLYVGLPKAEKVAHVRELERKMGLVMLLVTGLMAAGTFYLTNRLFRPMRLLADTMTVIGEGKTDVEVPARDREDEIGGMAKTLEHFRQIAIAKRQVEAKQQELMHEQQRVLDEVETALRRIEQGDLSQAIDSRFPAEFDGLKSSYNAAITSLGELVGAVKQRTDGLRSGSQEISDASEDLARRTESNAAAIEQTSAAATQIDQRLRSSAEAATATTTRASEAGALVQSGRAIAEEAVEAMNKVSDSAKGIDDVIEGLDKIAFQTRVLAMNAAVEAGRAGEAGLGFAQVADLVSALAMRAEAESSRAREQLTVTQSEIELAVGKVGQVDESLANIVNGVQEVNRLLSEMAEDNRVQSSAVTQVASTINTMESSTQQNAAMVEQTSAAARNLLNDVFQLASLAEQFRIPERSTFNGHTASGSAPARQLAHAVH